jgi:hypothetical protein
MATHAGHCHCGAVQFRIEGAITELTTCDCSLCMMRGALMAKVHESGLTVLAGEDRLTLYQWNTRTARHYFCSVCGIYVFHRKRSQPDHYGINARCLEGLDLAALPVRATEGIGMSVEDPAAPAHWRGPQAS